MEQTERDKPWIMRTYAGHTTAEDTNKLFKTNLSKGQTGLSVAFDLPTQTGYDSDHILSEGEVGKVGVPISHINDMETLFEDIRNGRRSTNYLKMKPGLKVSDKSSGVLLKTNSVLQTNFFTKDFRREWV